jgi:hypothetical protein
MITKSLPKTIHNRLRIVLVHGRPDHIKKHSLKSHRIEGTSRKYYTQPTSNRSTLDFDFEFETVNAEF